MASLVQRVNALISANMNWLAAMALRANSMAVVDEYIRKVEDNLEVLEEAAATVGGDAKSTRRKLEETQHKADELDANVDSLLSKEKDDLALAAQHRLNTIQRLAETYGEQYERQGAGFQELLDAKLKLEAKLTQARQDRVELQAMLDLAKSRELTHRAAGAAGGLTHEAAEPDSIREEIQRRIDMATAQGEIDATKLDRQIAAALEEDELKEQLAARRERLGI